MKAIQIRFDELDEIEERYEEFYELEEEHVIQDEGRMGGGPDTDIRPFL